MKDLRTLFRTITLILILTSLSIPASLAQDPDTLSQVQDTLTKKEIRKAKKAWKVEQGKPLFTPLAGPAYTPEMGFTVAGGIMISYKTNPKDSLIQRSSSPVMLGVTSTGGIFASTILSSYWLEDKLRIYGDFVYKDMPDNYYGVGYDDAFTTPESDSTTAYQRTWWWINPRFLWQFREHWFAGLIFDANSTKVSEPSQGVLQDEHYQEFGPDNMNIGLGVLARYDSRDIPVNAWEGIYADVRATFYSSVLGSNNTYQAYEVDFRKYWSIKRPGRTIALQAMSRLGYGDMPYGEMSQLGTPFDLRGYKWGQYRENSMLFFIGEYRHTFLKKDQTLSKHGVVGWLGTGSIGKDPSEFTHWLPNVGVGYRLEVQPRMNLRIDIGIGRESAGFYFNFNEAF
jgi:hypothetical protein